MSNDYLKQLQLTKQLEQKAKEATKNRKAAEDVLVKAGEALSKAKVPDVDLSEAEKVLAEANAAFAKRDYRAAISAASQASEIIPEAERAAVAAMLSSSEAVLALVPGDGREGDAKASMAAARDLLEKGKADEALAAARSSREQAERYLGTMISEMAVFMRSFISLAEGHGIPVAERWKALGEAESLHQQGDRTAALERLRAGREDLLRAFSGAFEERSTKIVAVIEDAASAGVDISSLSAALAGARADLDSGDAGKAMNGLATAAVSLPEALAAAVETRLAAHKERAAWLEERGISTEEHRVACTEAVRTGFGASSLEWLRRSEKALRDGEATVVLAEVEKLRPGLVLAKSIGNGLTGPLEKLEEARRAVQGAQAPRAMKLVAEAASQLDDILRGHRELEEELKRTALLFRRAGMYRVGLKAAGQAVAASRATALKGDLEGAARQLKEARGVVLRKVRRHCAEAALGAEVDIAFAAGMGMDTSSEAAELDDLVRTLREGGSEDALIRLSKVQRSISAKGRAGATASVERAESMVGGIPGIEMYLPVDVAREARRHLESGDWKAAHLAASDVLAITGQQQRQAWTAQIALARRIMDIGRQLGCESITLDQKMAAAGSSTSTVEALHILGEMVQYIKAIVKDELARAIPVLTEEIGAQRKNGVSFFRAERCVEEASEALGQDDLEKCFALLNDGEKELEKTVALHKEVGDLIALIASHVDDARPAAGKYGVPALLKETRDLYEAGKYDGARVFARKCYQELEKTGASVLAPEKLREAKEVVELLRQMSSGPTEADEDIKLASERLSKGDSAAALAAANNAHREATERLVAAISSQIESTRNMLISVKRRRLDLPASFDIIAEAENLLVTKRYADAVRAVRSARNEADQMVRVDRNAHNEVERGDAELSEIEGAGVDIGGERQSMVQALAALERGEQDFAMEQARKALKAARKTACIALTSRLDEAEGELKADELKGEDLEPVQAEARKAVQERLDRHRYSEAGELIDGYAADLRRLRSLRDRCAAALAEKEDLSRRGWPLIDMAEDLLAKAQAAFDHGAFGEAEGLLKERSAARNAAQALHDRSAARLADARRRLEEEGRGFPDESIAGLLSKASEELARGRYADMERSVMKAGAELALVRERDIRRDVAEVVRLTYVLRLLGVTLSSLPERTPALLDIRMSELREGSVDLSRDIDALRGAARERLTSSEATLRERMERARASGKQSGVSEALLEEARKALAGGDMVRALSLQKAARSALGASAADTAAYRNATARLYKALAAAGPLEIDVSAAVAMYHEASGMEGDLPGATGRIEDAAKSVEDRLAVYLPIIRLEAVPESAGRKVKVRAQNVGGGIALDLSVEEGAGELILPEMLRPGEAVEGIIDASEGSISLSYRGLMSRSPRTVRASLG